MTPNDIQTIILLIFGVITLGVILAGTVNACVIFYDAKDVVVSASSILFTLIGTMILASRVDVFDSDVLNQITKWVSGPALLLLGLYCLMRNFVVAIKTNRSLIIGLLIGVYKLLFTVIGVAAVVGYFARITDRRASARDILVAWILFGIFQVLAFLMINGERVEMARRIAAEAESA